MAITKVSSKKIENPEVSDERLVGLADRANFAKAKADAAAETYKVLNTQLVTEAKEFFLKEYVGKPDIPSSIVIAGVADGNPVRVLVSFKNSYSIPANPSPELREAIEGHTEVSESLNIDLNSVDAKRRAEFKKALTQLISVYNADAKLVEKEVVTEDYHLSHLALPAEKVRLLESQMPMQVACSYKK